MRQSLPLCSDLMSRPSPLLRGSQALSFQIEGTCDYFPSENHPRSSPFWVRSHLRCELTLAPQILTHVKSQKVKEMFISERTKRQTLRSNTTTGFCVKKPQKPLLTIELVLIPGVRRGPGAMSTELALALEQRLGLLTPRTVPAHSNASLQPRNASVRWSTVLS